jgi:uncharacterized protein (DUF1684 family)
MKWQPSLLVLPLFGLVGQLGVLAIHAAERPTPTPPAAPPPAWVKDDEAWRASRLDRLRAEDGWLTLVGLHWLKPDVVTRIGSAADNDVVLPAGPAHAGSLRVDAWGVHLKPEPGAVLLKDVPLEPVERKLRGDNDPEPDVLQVGRLRVTAIWRNLEWALRVKDPESPVRSGFKGIESYPIDAKWRVEATWEPYPTPRQLLIATAQGTNESVTSPGVAKFKLNGVEASLEPILEDPAAKELLFVFKDTTSGKTTYGAGRFLYADLPQDGKLVLDFNRAYNPPCAFTAYATCPLPPFRNRLKTAVEAGEKRYALEVPHASTPGRPDLTRTGTAGR